MSESIMNCTADQLRKICDNYLRQYDDYQQIAADRGNKPISLIFVDAYDQLEWLKSKIKNKPSNNLRNDIRVTVQHYFRIANLAELESEVEIANV